MDFGLTETQKMFREAIRDFGEKEVAPIVEEAEEKESCPVEIFSKLGKLGFLCPGYPVEYGGGGLGKTGDCIMIEELARINSGITSGLMVQAGLATSAILQHVVTAAPRSLPPSRSRISACLRTTPPISRPGGGCASTTRT